MAKSQSPFVGRSPLVVLAAVFSAAALALMASPAGADAPGITLVGVGGIPGTATDLSGLTGRYTDPTDPSDSIPADLLGSFGSGIAYTGFGDRYLAVDDRGFDEGLVNFLCRMQVFDITVDASSGSVTPTLAATRLLAREDGRNFTGLSSAFLSPTFVPRDPATDPANNLREDPESIRYAPDGTYYVSDEYGPNLYRFDQSGRRIGVIPVPDEFKVIHLNADGTTETAENTQGRVTDRGFEGLSIAPDGCTLFAIMQSPLIQDGGQSGINNRILKVDLVTGREGEYVYELQSASDGVSEMVAVNDHQFLVDERDANAGTAAKYKELNLIDVDGATDVTGMTLPLAGLPSGVKPVSKSPFLNLLNPTYGLAGPSFPEKIEGVTFGPDFPDGDHLLLLTNDNDLDPSQPNDFFAFRIPHADLPSYQAEWYFVPFFVPSTEWPWF